MSLNGVVNVYKEPGFTSFNVVYKIRKLFNVKKVGHTGTLDPMAEGVLPICVGYATRFSDMITAGDKQYIAKFRLGASYDTFDITGAVTAESDAIPDEDTIRSTLNKLIGNIELPVPTFSAKWVDGRRAYDMARKGVSFDLGKTAMNIHNIELISYEYAEGTFVIDCSKGTYVRSVIHEMGQMIGSFAAMSGLVRSRNGSFHMNDSHKLADIESAVEEGRIADILIPVENTISLKRAVINESATAYLLNGIPPAPDDYTNMPPLNDGEQCLIFTSDGRLAALGEMKKERIKLVKVFLPIN